MRWMAVTAALLTLTGAARAEEAPRNEKRDYPASLIERPMTLPPLMFQPTLEVNLTNHNSIGTTPSGQGESLGIGLDVGVARRLELGVFFAFPLHPLADFGGFIFDLQGNLQRGLNFRFDLGTERLTSGSGTTTSHQDTFVFGLGLPLKAKLGRYVAIVSGSTQARGFGKPALLAFGGGGFWGGAATQSNDILAVEVAPVSGFGGVGSGTAVALSLHLPIGVLIQPHPIVSFAVRTGYRFIYSSTPGTSLIGHEVPLAFDLMFTVARIVDLGFTATLYGFVTSTSSVTGFGSTTSSGGYADVQRYDFWFAGRF